MFQHHKTLFTFLIYDSHASKNDATVDTQKKINTYAAKTLVNDVTWKT